MKCIERRMDPKISVIVPTYYRNDLLPEAIESVVDQEYEPVELIVVDDSGEGHAEPVIDEFDGVIDKAIIREDNGGWEAANTTGIEASTGEYVQFLDDDDYLLEGKLSKTAAVLQENPDVGVSYCGAIRSDTGEFYPKPEVCGDILEHTLRCQAFPLWTATMLIERHVLLDCLPFPGTVEGQDFEVELNDSNLKIELAKRTKFDYVDECLAFYRRDSSSLWVGKQRLKKIKEVVRHQRELYDQYPEIRRQLLAEWYARRGRNLLEERLWSADAIGYFLKSLSLSEDQKLKRGFEMASSLFGRPGHSTLVRAHDLIRGETGGDVR